MHIHSREPREITSLRIRINADLAMAESIFESAISRYQHLRAAGFSREDASLRSGVELATLRVERLIAKDEQLAVRRA